MSVYEHNGKMYDTLDELHEAQERESDLVAKAKKKKSWMGRIFSKQEKEVTEMSKEDEMLEQEDDLEEEEEQEEFDKEFTTNSYVEEATFTHEATLELCGDIDDLLKLIRFISSKDSYHLCRIRIEPDD